MNFWYLNITFIFNTLSHLTLSFLFFRYNFNFIFQNLKLKNVCVFLFAVGHFLIGFAQYFLRYGTLSKTAISSKFGILGHLCLFIYSINSYLLNSNIYNFTFLVGQMGMIYFYSQSLSTDKYLSFQNIKLNKKYIYIATFIVLFLWYSIKSIFAKSLFRYGIYLVSIVYLNLIIYQIINDNTHIHNF